MQRLIATLEKMNSNILQDPSFHEALRSDQEFQVTNITGSNSSKVFVQLLAREKAVLDSIVNFQKENRLE